MTDIQPSAETAPQTASKFTNNKEIIAYLAQRFPLCFSVEGEAKPLKIGIFQDLAEALAGDEQLSKTQLRHALRQYTSNWRYLYGCREGAQRVDLNGEAAGILDAEHAAHAAAQLAEAKARFAEKRKAELAEKKAKQKAARKPKNPNFKPRKPQVKFTALDFSQLTLGASVRVKAGDRTQKGSVVELLKESARVQLENGVILNVAAERLFA